MNILIFISSLDCGGAERMVANLANHWADKGWQITVLTMSLPASDFYHIDSCVKRISLGFAVEKSGHSTAVRAIKSVCRIPTFRKVMRQLNPDVTLSMMSDANVLLGLAGFGFKKMVKIGSVRCDPFGSEFMGFRAILCKVVYRYLTAVVALTEEAAVWLQRNTSASDVLVIPCAVDFPICGKSYCEIIDTASIVPNGRRILLSVGRLSKSKGFDLILFVFQRLASRFAEWVLVILGEGEERRALEDYVRLNDLADRVYLLGRVRNIDHWYKAADLHVLGSRTEGFSNALIEALAYGLPTVSFDCESGPRHIIRHGIDGFLVPAGDVAALEVALDRLMRDQFLRRKFSARAIDARERFSLEKISFSWESLFREKCAGVIK